jgi:hypothetical protein
MTGSALANGGLPPTVKRTVLTGDVAGGGNDVDEVVGGVVLVDPFLNRLNKVSSVGTFLVNGGYSVEG